MKNFNFFLVAAILIFTACAQAEPLTNPPAWFSGSLSIADALNTALQQNATISKAKNDLQIAHGLVVQTRAVALPQLQAFGKYEYESSALLQEFPGANYPQPNQFWDGGVQLTQTIYDGGRLVAAFRAADVTKKQAIAQYQTTVATTLLTVRLAYYDVLLAAEQITVHEASVNLLQKELEDQQHRFDAGTVPKFQVLRADVALANEKPNLIQARNNYRISKNNLVNLLGYNLPREIWEDVPLNLSDTLATAPYDVNLPDAIQQALARRTELVALQRTEELQRLNIVNARAGYKPVVQVFGGYTYENSPFSTDIGEEIHGWMGGAQMTWNIFDGLLTHGKVIQAKAEHEKSLTDVSDEVRQIELEVRTDYSGFIEAKEVLDSQSKVQEEADEALREAKARADAGTSTQLDVLDAENSLTQARAILVQAQHDYVAARARLEHAIGNDLALVK